MWSVDSVASAVFHVKTFPCFDIAHNLLACIEVRNELSRHSFSQNHPFCSWLFTIAFIFSGSLTSNLLLGEPIVAPLANMKLLLVASTIWYLVFFAQFDFAYKIGTSPPVKLVACTLNEMYRARKIENGILQASSFYPDSWAIVIAIATIRSNGSGIVKLVMRLMQKTQSPNDVEFMQLPFSAKISMLAAFLLVLEKKFSCFGSYELLYFAITVFFVFIKVCSLLASMSPKCLPLENLLYTMCFKNVYLNESALPKPSQKEKNPKDLKKVY